MQDIGIPAVPSYVALMNPVLEALFQLGGSGSNNEILATVISIAGIEESVAAVLHHPKRGSLTKLAYRLAWARTYLKKAGYLENSKMGIWSLTPKAKEQKTVNATQVSKWVRNQKSNPTDNTSNQEPEETNTWREEVFEVMIHQLSPEGFERLCQRLLRETGFIQVEVTGRTGDGGIDGRGIARINGFMSFRVVFQCKKYQGSVSASDIRDFRGATIGRADRGLFLTTGTFTPAAVAEATREGAPLIDLIDGELLVEKLKQFRLGLNVEMVERVEVDREWFRNL